MKLGHGKKCGGDFVLGLIIPSKNNDILTLLFT